MAGFNLAYNNPPKLKGTIMQNSVIIHHNSSSMTSQHTVIWLHGLGANGDDFVPIVPELGLDLPVKFIFPNADLLSITINGGYVMPAWYDILAMDDITREVDLVQIGRSARRIMAIIDSEIARGVPIQNIVLAGFSQGGAIAYEVALQLLKQNKKLGGLLALSTYFATYANYCPQDFADSTLPTAIHHGSFDVIVAPQLGKQAFDALTALNFTPNFRLYPMAHQVCPEQIIAIGQWLTCLLNNRDENKQS